MTHAASQTVGNPAVYLVGESGPESVTLAAGTHVVPARGPRPIGWIGLGKLGLTCAAVLADRGHQVVGFDVSPWARDVLDGAAPPPAERGFTGLHTKQLIIAGTVAEVVATSEVIFVSVQTPHAPQYGGEVPAPTERSDFEYGYLVDACRSVCRAAAEQARSVTLVVVSTVLPGTCNRLIKPLLNEYVTLVYNPFFIAMGTTVEDFTKPEFVLLGADRQADLWPVEDVYRGLHYAPFARMSIESAELTKVAYNTFISMKIVWANTVMEICHKTGADCDAVVDALEMAEDRVISAKYMRGGMGDGGHCHPRDLIAMSWLAERLDLSYDLLGEMAKAREAQSWWLARVVRHWCEVTGLEPAVLGKAYKPESPLTGGSPALLLAYQLGDPPTWDPHIDGGPLPHTRPRVFVVATMHPEFAEYAYPRGSVVIDPWGYVPDQDGVTVVRVGRKT
jgi:UDPglucose 6-dehydrogenase